MRKQLCVYVSMFLYLVCILVVWVSFLFHVSSLNFNFLPSAGAETWSSLCKMSQATKRKHVVKEVLGDFVTPTETQQIVKVSLYLPLLMASSRTHITANSKTPYAWLYLHPYRSSVAVATTSTKLSRPRVRRSWSACRPSSARTSGSREVTSWWDVQSKYYRSLQHQQTRWTAAGV